MQKILGLLVVLAMASPAVAQQAAPAIPVKAESATTAGAPAKPVTLTVTYTDQEAAVLLRLLDMAVRQGGLEAAGNAAFLANKIKDAAKAAGLAQPPAPPPKQGTNE